MCVGGHRSVLVPRVWRQRHGPRWEKGGVGLRSLMRYPSKPAVSAFGKPLLATLAYSSSPNQLAPVPLCPSKPVAGHSHLALMIEGAARARTLRGPVRVQYSV